MVTAFYGYLGAKAVLESAQRSLALSQAQVEVTAARTTAGVANELELMRARAEVERNQQLVADAEALVANGARSLETLTGLEPRRGAVAAGRRAAAARAAADVPGERGRGERPRCRRRRPT